jgi:hypothetical protein
LTLQDSALLQSSISFLFVCFHLHEHKSNVKYWIYVVI